MGKNKRLVLCSTEVASKEAVTREDLEGVEHIRVASYTLPFNIVMNGVIYPEEEIIKSYEGLERVLAPLEHPVSPDGHFIPASDPYAINNYHIGAHVENVRIEGSRVAHDFVINVQEAMKTDRGKRLLDRINELEVNSNPRPIHTSVGLFLEIEKLSAPQTNASGQEYDLIGKNFEWDHNAILLDSVGAAQPSQGVGIAVNFDGDKIDVERFVLNEEPVTLSTVLTQLEESIKSTTGNDDISDLDLIGDTVVFKTDVGWFQVPYIIDTNSDTARITGLPIRVDRKVVYNPKVNSNNEGDAMKDIIVNALKAKDIVTEGLSDDELMVQYNEMLQANQSTSDDAPATDEKSLLADIVANAVAPVLAKIGEIEGIVNAKAEGEKDELATLIANSGKYPGLDVDSAKMLPVDKLKEMAANCSTSYGLPLSTNAGGAATQFNAPTEMPK